MGVAGAPVKARAPAAEPAPPAEHAATHTKAIALASVVPLLDQYLAITALDTDAHEQWAAGLILRFAAEADDGERECRSATSALKKVAKQIEAWWRPGVNRRREVVAHLKHLIAARREAARAACAVALTEARSQVEIQAATAVLLAPPPEGLVEVGSWGWEVDPAMPPNTDPISVIPRRYWILDTAALDADAAEHGAALAIPGIVPKYHSALRRAPTR